ncbi:protein of unknown function [Taphrina deformans PYCC 5710]|uniref:Cell wall protein n=1 Tax=Taphrina deformans (strain PYCC 5710 / ATCC 11124 / CBS 356.35 / IMI 108563 / JCM 9778 / NBRC 8474) TaxID=1097556 RepID=R4X8E6_TAPDE|nr:protein of unknown function [Taphrina deformans PYCC 5710]|eukprot:CCG81853.1 protein of unknown function [Taphrina deformans PYCC 5710]
MQFSLILVAVVASVSAADFMGIDTSQGCADYLNGADPMINALGPKIEAVEKAAVGTSVEQQAKDANAVAKTALTTYNEDRKKKASELSPDKALIQTDMAKGKAALIAISSAPDSTPVLTQSVKDLNSTVDALRTYGRGALKPCGIRDLSALRTGFKDVGVPQSRVADSFQTLLSYDY